MDGNRPTESHLCSPIGERIALVVKLSSGSFHIFPLIDGLGGAKGQPLRAYESVHEACVDLSKRHYDLTTPRSGRFAEQLNRFFGNAIWGWVFGAIMTAIAIWGWIEALSPSSPN